MRACMESSSAKDNLAAQIAEAKRLEVNSTPTLFNKRQALGSDRGVFSRPSSRKRNVSASNELGSLRHGFKLNSSRALR